MLTCHTEPGAVLTLEFPYNCWDIRHWNGDYQVFWAFPALLSSGRMSRCHTQHGNTALGHIQPRQVPPSRWEVLRSSHVDTIGFIFSSWKGTKDVAFNCQPWWLGDSLSSQLGSLASLTSFKVFHDYRPLLLVLPCFLVNGLLKNSSCFG